MKKILSLLLLALLSVTQAMAYSFEVGGIYYNVSGTNATVTYKDNNYNSYSGDVVIPETVTYGDVTYNVTTIGTWSFYGCTNLTSISIPQSVTRIEQAFSDCTNLTSVRYSDIQSLLNISFFNDYSNPLKFAHHLYFGDDEEEVTEVVIPEVVTSINSYAFHGCSSLTSVTFPESVTSIGRQAFYQCSSLTSVTLPESVTNIGNRAFSSCSSLTSVTLPESVTNIGAYAFSGCSSLEDINIPEAVTIIEDNTFAWCSSLTSITIPESVTKIGYNAFYYCSNLASICIPKNVNSLISGCFDGCNNLKSITLSRNFFSSFRNYNYDWHLTSSEVLELSSSISNNCLIYVPAELLEAYKTANNWKDHASQILAEGTKGDYEVTTIADPNLSSLMLKVGEEELQKVISLTISGSINGYDMMIIRNKMPHLRNLDLSAANIESLDFEYSVGNKSVADVLTKDWLPKNIYSLVLPQNITTIGNGAFEGLVSIQDIEIPECVTSIGERAFYGCSQLQHVNIPNNVTNIQPYTFEGCDKLKGINIPDGMTSIGENAFYGCTFETISIPRSLKSIGKNAFKRGNNLGFILNLNIDNEALCSEAYFGRVLREVVIGNSVTRINDWAFDRCVSLSRILIPESVKSIGTYAFYRCENLTSIEIHSSVSTIGASAFYGCSKLTSCILPRDSKLTTIPQYAFQDCSALERMDIPVSVTKIENYAFQNCTSLAEMRIPSGMSSIGNYAFDGCTKLYDVYTYTVEPQDIQQQTFSTNSYNNGTLHCPKVSYYNYYFATPWNQFLNLTAFDEPYEYVYINKDFSIMNDVVSGDPEFIVGNKGALIMEGLVEQMAKIFHINMDAANGLASSIINNGFINAAQLKVKIDVKKDFWHFFSFPFDVDLTNGVEKDGSWIFREFDGMSRAENGAGNSWKDITGTKLEAGKGYIFRTNTAGPLTLTIDNPKFDHADAVAVLKECKKTVGETEPANKNWNFIGNLFSSYYDINSLDYSAPIMTWDGTKYVAYRPGDDDCVLTPFQGFFVQKPETGNTGVGFLKAGRTTYLKSQDPAARSASRRKAAARLDSSRKLVNLTVCSATDEEATADKARVVFNEKQTMDYELECDASKFISTENVPLIYSLDARGTRYAINERPMADGRVNLGFIAREDGQYTIAATRMDVPVVLIDNATGTTHDLNDGDYIFTADKGTYEQRFVLAVAEDYLTDGITTVSTDEQGAAANIYDLQGKRVERQQQGVTIQNGKKVVSAM